MRQNLCWDYLALILTQLVEVVMYKGVVLKRGVGTEFPEKAPNTEECYTK